MDYRAARVGLKIVEKSGSPWENGYIDSFKGKQRGELLNRENFTTLTKTGVLVKE
ncbi:integrase core domain-containing protein [Chloroflexota bacterium]